MRTVQLTFTFEDEQWEVFRKIVRLWGAEPTYSNVCCALKLLAIKGAKVTIDEVQTVIGLAEEADRYYEKLTGRQKND